MKSLPIHTNLDTSFVNLSALVRYLRRRQFVGSIRIELNGYEADISLSEGNGMKVHEHDRIAGRIAEGEEALQRLLIRAREPGGTINVYQLVDEPETVEPEVQPVKVEPKVQPVTIEQKIQSVVENGNGKPFVQREILTQIPASNGGEKKSEIKLETPHSNGREAIPPKDDALPKHSDVPKDNAPLPFEFSNRVEAKAKQAQISAEEWQTLLQLTVELLGAVDRTLAAANLDFSSAFTKACVEISGDYPFLSPNAGVFGYSNRRLTMREQVNSKVFVASINEALRRILEKLGANTKFADVYRDTVQTILALIHQRKPLYDKFFITPQLEKILGV